jgi:GNAT superfamily N-acetyltransferase
MFVAAVRTHFTYFPEIEQEKVIRDHRLIKLLLASINPRRVILTAYHGGELVGYAIGSVPSDGKGQLFWLYVDPRRRGNNTGLTLLSRMLRVQGQLGATQVTLATYDHRRYYERQGFVLHDAYAVEGVLLDIMIFKLGNI